VSRASNECCLSEDGSEKISLDGGKGDRSFVERVKMRKKIACEICRLHGITDSLRRLTA